MRGEKEYRIHEPQKHEQKRKRINRTEHRYVVVVQHMKKLGVCLEQKENQSDKDTDVMAREA